MSSTSVWEWLRRRLPRRASSDLRWWERMAERVGPRAVLHQGHTEEEMPRITEWQKEILFPMLRAELSGTERTVLDFGCGPGRFTSALAELIDGDAIGVDPIPALLERAPRHRRVEYRLLEGTRIPAADETVDVAWICLVLMCITDETVLRRSVEEIGRVLRPDGLVFLAENTQERPDLKHLRFRSVERYQELFSGFDLRPVGEYHDLGERISVLAGRRRRPGGRP